MIRSPLFALTVLAAACLGLAPLAARAAQSYDNCTGFIDSLPATITSGGTWCLRKDLNTTASTGTAIEVRSNNVTIDYNDFRIGGLGAGEGSSATGIGAQDRRNITIRRCNIRGFKVGVMLLATTNTGAGGHLVENNRLDRNNHVGLLVEGNGSVVRGNIVRDTGGNVNNFGQAYGISTRYDVDVLDNTVQYVSTLEFNDAASTWGIHAYSNYSGSISRNRVRGVASFGEGTAYGIAAPLGNRLIMRDNDLRGPGGVGLQCDPAGFAHVVATGNMVNGFAQGIDGCIDVGNKVATW